MAERKGADAAAMVAHGGNFPPRRDIPDFHDAVVARAEQPFPVRAETDGANDIGVAVQRQEFAPMFDVPQFQRPRVTAGRERLAVGTDAQAAHRRVMPFQAHGLANAMRHVAQRPDHGLSQLRRRIHIAQHFSGLDAFQQTPQFVMRGEQRAAGKVMRLKRAALRLFVQRLPPRFFPGEMPMAAPDEVAFVAGQVVFALFAPFFGFGKQPPPQERAVVVLRRLPLPHRRIQPLAPRVKLAVKLQPFSQPLPARNQRLVRDFDDGVPLRVHRRCEQARMRLGKRLQDVLNLFWKPRKARHIGEGGALAAVLPLFPGADEIEKHRSRQAFVGAAERVIHLFRPIRQCPADAADALQRFFRRIPFAHPFPQPRQREFEQRQRARVPFRFGDESLRKLRRKAVSGQFRGLFDGFAQVRARHYRHDDALIHDGVVEFGEGLRLFEEIAAQRQNDRHGGRGGG